jgi:hypothetical protein
MHLPNDHIINSKQIIKAASIFSNTKLINVFVIQYISSKY